MARPRPSSPAARRPSPAPQPGSLLEGVERLVVDGSNVLGALARETAQEARATPPAALVGRLRAAIPAGVRIELVFDGPSAGSPTGRVAEQMSVRFSGRRTADTLIAELAATGALGGQPPGSNVVVVTDDRELAAIVRRQGVRAVGSAWLLRRLGTAPLAAPSPGHRRPPRQSTTEVGRTAGAIGPAGPDERDLRDEDAVADARRWRPGRGATAKAGPSRRAPRGALVGVRRRKRPGGPAR